MGGLLRLSVFTEPRQAGERLFAHADIELKWGRQVVNFGRPTEDLPKSFTSTEMGNSTSSESEPKGGSKVDVEEFSQTSWTRQATIDSNGLSWPGTLQRKEESGEEKEERLRGLSGAIRTILACVGEDPDRPGLRNTPDRYAKAMLFFTEGYGADLCATTNQAIFPEDYDEMVIVKDIEFFSLCEHHLVPFSGKEKLTKQVAFALSKVLESEGIAVVVESSHLCMVMRGVQKTGVVTTTSSMLGCLHSNDKKREEFLSLIGRK
ncbi:MAG: hypothetical protein Q9165_005110 [Trypethelium subeluteriae]